MFERLTDRFAEAFKSLTGRGILTEDNINEAMREVRRALLEADVNYQVVKEFTTDVKASCLGEKVLKSVSPGQQAVKVVNDKLVELLGESNQPLVLSGKPAVVLLVGLHGSGKTTTAAKLALHLRDKQGRKPFLVAADLYRPAAIDQLRILGSQLQIPVYLNRDTQDVARVAVEGLNQAREAGADTLIIDTAGRLQIDTDLVNELKEIKQRVQPSEILLVADAALGQEAVSVAQHFDEALGITGIILTKLDGDARGGAALSMRRVTGKPVKFVGLGERTIDFDVFYPERMASRILGMGDIVGLVERAAEHMEEEDARQLEEKMRRNEFDFNDFLKQLRMIRRMGGFAPMLDLLPGMGKIKDQVDIDDSHFNRIEGMICSMTPQERQHPELLNMSRRQRIARGCGLETLEVNQFLKQFTDMRKMMGKLGKVMGKGGGMKLPNMDELQDSLGGMPGFGGGMPGGGFGSPSGGRGSRNQKSKKKVRKKGRH